jgi:hypothetical protein
MVLLEVDKELNNGSSLLQVGNQWSPYENGMTNSY